MVSADKEPRLWLLLKQEEERVRRIGSGRFLIGKLVTDHLFHFDLQAHDPANVDRLWKTRLLTVKDDAGGRTAQARILGQDGEVVWLFLHDGPVAVSTKDGRQLADRAAIEERNPALRTLIPKNVDLYAYDGGLVMTAEDARRFRIRAHDFAAEPYAPPEGERPASATSSATRRDGGYATSDFVVRQMMLDGRWVGLFNEKEAADAGNDEFGDKMATGEPGSNPDRVYHQASKARRTFWNARLGKTRDFPEGAHDRLFEVAKVPGAPEFLEAGLLIRQGTKQALRLEDPNGFLVLHRTKLGEDGRLALTRLDDHLKSQWTATLPFHDLRNRYESPGHLLLYGIVQQTEKGVTSTSEHLVALNLRDGKTQSWNVPQEKRVE